MSYLDFVKSKKWHHGETGIPGPFNLSPELFGFQRVITEWALKRGRAAIFADTGLGKSFMEMEWARAVAAETSGNVLIVAPLCVAKQFVHEGEKFHEPIRYARKQDDVTGALTVTNYEMIDAFDMEEFTGVVLDESSILKHQDSKTRQKMIDICQPIPYRLSATATPSPNDYMEIGGQAEFLGVMKTVEMLATFFIHDGSDTSKWRLKGHGAHKFWEWLAGWAIVIRKPSDLGFDNSGYDLPPLNVHDRVIPGVAGDGLLFPGAIGGLEDRRRVRKLSLTGRVKACADRVNTTPGKWIVWCDLNAESDALARAIPDAIEVVGSDSIAQKEKATEDFLYGDLRVLVSKSSIFGFGMNFQHCHQMAFVGLSDSWEAYYQAIRRCYRFGQTQPVEVDIFYSENESEIIDNVRRKGAAATEMQEQMEKQTHRYTEQSIKGTRRDDMEMKIKTETGDGWSMMLGDCVESIRTLKPDSIHYSIFSPPFASLYTYSNSDFDMGNCRNDDEFYGQFKFLVSELHRVLMPGRLLSFHCMNLPTTKTRDGYIGIKDFRGELIKMFIEAGFIYHSEVCIWKDPVTAMQRTKALGLLHKQLKKDSAMSRQGIPDYLVTMRKPGVNPEPVSHTNDSFPVALWQRFASPIWMDIDQGNTLNGRGARENEDERHICPLQLDVIQRGIDLWTNPDDLVLSPFAGIGSEGYISVKSGRRFVGMELKESYFDEACRNLRDAEKTQAGLFAEATS